MSKGGEETNVFAPIFNAEGLIPAIVTDASGGDVLMFAFMNREALRLTIDTGEAHFWSRSRGSLWRKGETSGDNQRVVEILTDCDQDTILLRVEPRGSGNACHTGRKSCFYRRVTGADNLEFI
jgi:phosphoribosyl-AMP cyclohydrolase